MIEKEIFKKSYPNYEKLEKYGFQKEKDIYIYSKTIMNDKFKVDIWIDNGKVFDRIIDLKTNEEYINYRIKSQNGSFVSQVREQYNNLLVDIKNSCFINNYFVNNQANRITNYIIEKYGDYPEFLWENYPEFGVFRNKNNNKWYAIIMNINGTKIGLKDELKEIINVKVNSNEIDDFLKENGYFAAYHMNKKYWITMVLDDTLNDKEVISLLDNSYKLVNG